MTLPMDPLLLLAIPACGIVLGETLMVTAMIDYPNEAGRIVRPGKVGPKGIKLRMP